MYRKLTLYVANDSRNAVIAAFPMPWSRSIELTLYPTALNCAMLLPFIMIKASRPEDVVIISDKNLDRSPLFALKISSISDPVIAMPA